MWRWMNDMCGIEFVLSRVCVGPRVYVSGRDFVSGLQPSGFWGHLTQAFGLGCYVTRLWRFK